jgi:dihydroneopterin aldolase
VLISSDEMNNVFDYDPLITEVKSLACDGHYQTQERLISRIVDACAGRPQVTAIEIYLRKTPVTNSGGTLGIRIKVDAEHLAEIREKLFDNS